MSKIASNSNGVVMASKGRPRKYDFSVFTVGESKQYKGRDVNKNSICAAAHAYSKKNHNGEWKFSFQSGTDGLLKIVIVTRTA